MRFIGMVSAQDSMANLIIVLALMSVVFLSTAMLVVALFLRSKWNHMGPPASSESHEARKPH